MTHIQDKLQDVNEYNKLHYKNISLPIAFFMMENKELVLCDANPAFQYHMKENYLIGYSAEDLFSEELIDVKDNLYKAYYTKKNLNFQLRIRTSSAKKSLFYYATVSYVPPDGVNLVLVDITPLQKEEQEYKNYFKYAGDVTLLFQKNKIIDCNDRALELLKGTRGDLLGLTLWDISPERQSDGQFSWAKAIKIIKNSKTGVSTGFEWQYKTLKNNLVDVEVTLNMQDKSKDLYIVTWRDITEKKKIETKIIESEQKFHKVFMYSPNSISITRSDTGEYVEINEGFERNTGYTADEVIGKTPEDVLLWKNTGHKRVILNTELKEKGRVRNFEVELTAKDGSVLNSIINIETITLKNEKYYLAIGINITDLKRANKELEVYKNKLEELVDKRTNELINANYQLKAAQQQLIQSEKMASIGLLSAGVAHEINNPINYISGGVISLKCHFQKITDALQLFMDNCNVNCKFKQCDLPVPDKLNYAIKESDKMFQGIQAGIDKTIGIIESMRVFSNESEDIFAKVDINEMLESIVAQQYNSYKHRIKIVKDLCANSVIEGISDKLQQAFVNILTNAIQSIEEEGLITLKTARVKNRWLMVTISDTGLGIAKNVNSKIFDPFYTTKNVGNGTGLGLFLSYYLVEQHKGTITYNSEINKGTEFIIKIPVKQIDNG